MRAVVVAMPAALLTAAVVAAVGWRWESRLPLLLGSSSSPSAARAIWPLVACGIFAVVAGVLVGVLAVPSSGRNSGDSGLAGRPEAWTPSTRPARCYTERPLRTAPPWCGRWSSVLASASARPDSALGRRLAGSGGRVWHLASRPSGSDGGVVGLRRGRPSVSRSSNPSNGW